MFVSRSMTHKVITVGPQANIFEAQELMAQNPLLMPAIDCSAS